ncbi:MAG: hypothetical protein ABIJ41_05765 [Candidatus Omnitrophota bacterium]
MKLMKMIILVVVLTFLVHSNIFAQEAAYFFKSKDLIPEINQFMKLRSQLSGKITSQKRSEIYFALGEYYFKNGAARDASVAFGKCIEEDSSHSFALVANAFLLKLALKKHDQEKVDFLKKEMFRDQFILLFNEFKKIDLTSQFGNAYEIYYYVDKIEIFLNGNRFMEITP